MDKRDYLKRSTLCLVASFKYAAIISYSIAIPINLKCIQCMELSQKISEPVHNMCKIKITPLSLISAMFNDHSFP